MSKAPDGVRPFSWVADGVNARLVKAASGYVYGFQVFHVAAAPIYLKLYDQATLPVSTDVPVARFGIPLDAAAAAGSELNVQFPEPIRFEKGIGARLVTGIADTNDVAVGADTALVTLQRL